MPDLGQVGLDDVEGAAEECGYVLHEDEPGSKRANGVGDGGPDAGVFAGDAAAFAGVGDVLAREPGGEDLDRFHPAPVDVADVADVDDVGPLVAEDGPGVRVGFGVPGEPVAEDLFDGEVEPAVAGAQ